MRYRESLYTVHWSVYDTLLHHTKDSYPVFSVTLKTKREEPIERDSLRLTVGHFCEFIEEPLEVHNSFTPKDRCRS